MSLRPGGGRLSPRGQAGRRPGPSGEGGGGQPRRRGRLNGKPFEHLRDADDLFGSVLEVLSQGAYYWVPLEQVASLAMSAPPALQPMT